MGEAARDATTVGENDAMDLSAALAAYVRVALNLDKLDWVWQRMRRDPPPGLRV